MSVVKVRTPKNAGTEKSVRLNSSTNRKDKAIPCLIKGKRIRIIILLKEVITSPASSIVVWTQLSALPVMSMGIGKKMSTWTMITPHME